MIGIPYLIDCEASVNRLDPGLIFSLAGLPIKWFYHTALDRDANERAAFLADACAGDEALRGAVESLLHCDARAERFIEAPPSKSPPGGVVDRSP